MVTEPQWEETVGFVEGLACVKRDGKWGSMDKTGRVVIDPQWEDAYAFYEGPACVKQGGKYGFIDKTGRVMIEPQWDWTGNFSEGLAAVGQGQFPKVKYGFIDKTGRVIIEPQWDVLADSCLEASNASYYWLFARQEGTKVVVAWLDSKGKQIWSSDNDLR